MLTRIDNFLHLDLLRIQSIVVEDTIVIFKDYAGFESKSHRGTVDEAADFAGRMAHQVNDAVKEARTADMMGF